MRQFHRQSQQQKDFYNSHGPQYLTYKENIPYARYLVGKLLPWIKGQATRVIEIGAGQGRFSLELAQHVSSLLATDLSSRQLKILRREARGARIHNIETALCDALVIDKKFTGRFFDAVVGFFVLHHLPRPALPALASSLSRVVKRRGVAVFVEPNSFYPFHLVEMLITPDMHWEIEKGIYTNYLWVIAQALTDHGFTITHRQPFGFIPPFVINRFPGMVAIDGIVAKIPLLRQLLCPFVLLVAQKR